MIPIVTLNLDDTIGIAAMLEIPLVSEKRGRGIHLNLSEYIRDLPREKRSRERARIASECGVTESAVRHWCNGTRSIVPRHWNQLVQLTDGAVTIESLLDESQAA